MTEYQQRIAIAEACGWKDIHVASDCEFGEFLVGLHPTIGRAQTVPDYLNDLNAMHEAEKFLTGDQWQVYFDLLVEKIAGSSVNPSHAAYPLVAHATAAQRAEGILRVTGKWEKAK